MWKWVEGGSGGPQRGRPQYRWRRYHCCPWPLQSRCQVDFEAGVQDAFRHFPQGLASNHQGTKASHLWLARFLAVEGFLIPLHLLMRQLIARIDPPEDPLVFPSPPLLHPISSRFSGPFPPHRARVPSNRWRGGCTRVHWVIKISR